MRYDLAKTGKDYLVHVNAHNIKIENHLLISKGYLPINHQRNATKAIIIIGIHNKV